MKGKKSSCCHYGAVPDETWIMSKGGLNSHHTMSTMFSMLGSICKYDLLPSCSKLKKQRATIHLMSEIKKTEDDEGPQLAVSPQCMPTKQINLQTAVTSR